MMPFIQNKTCKEKSVFNLNELVCFVYKPMVPPQPDFKLNSQLTFQSTVSLRKDPSIPNSSSVVLGLPWRFDSFAMYFCCWSRKSRLSSTFFFQYAILLLNVWNKTFLIITRFSYTHAHQYNKNRHTRKFGSRCTFASIIWR